MANNPEQLSSHERGVEAQEAAKERLEQLANNPESSQERSAETKEHAVEKAKVEAEQEAEKAEKKNAGAEKAHTTVTPKRTTRVSRKEKTASFNKHMQRVQSELPAGSRAFSKVIHNRAVESTSNVVGATIARPNAILSGAVFAFVIVLAVYVVAKTFGYTLSGFETIGAFIVGWLLGILYDYLRVLITGKSA